VKKKLRTSKTLHKSLTTKTKPNAFKELVEENTTLLDSRYKSVRSLGKILIMGRPKDEHCWDHVTKVENSKKWICNYCGKDSTGGASRIKAHLGLGPPKAPGGVKGIRKCSNYPVNEGVNNNMASTSRNPPQAVINTIAVTHDQGKSTSVFTN
jgi:hypothetical protein